MSANLVPPHSLISLPQAQRAAIEAEVAAFGAANLHTSTVAQARAALDARRRARPRADCDSISISNIVIDRRSASVRVRTYRPHDVSGDRRVIYCHGGGWIMGQPSDFDTICARIAASLKCEVVSPDYRLAPEHPYPAALDDVITTMHGVVSTGELTMIGESAGATLALSAVIAARDRGDPLPANLVLFYPVLDTAPPDADRAPSLDSPLLTANDIDWCWRHYLSPEDAAADHAIPGRTADLRGLPPILLISGTIDPTLPATRAFATRAQSAGVMVEERYYQSLPHAFTALIKHNLIAAIVDAASAWIVARDVPNEDRGETSPA